MILCGDGNCIFGVRVDKGKYKFVPLVRGEWSHYVEYQYMPGCVYVMSPCRPWCACGVFATAAGKALSYCVSGYLLGVGCPIEFFRGL